MIRDTLLAGTLLASTIPLGACAPSLHQTMLGTPTDPAGTAADVQVWSEKTPECAFDEIAIVTARRAGLFPSGMEEALEALRQRAWELGADAVLGLEELSSAGEFPEPGYHGAGYRGTAIRFTDPACRR